MTGPMGPMRACNVTYCGTADSTLRKCNVGNGNVPRNVTKMQSRCSGVQGCAACAATAGQGKATHFGKCFGGLLLPG